MSNVKLNCIVMAGGQGTRFWPESTRKRPKQYLSLLGEENLLTASLKRFEGLTNIDSNYIVTVREQLDLAEESSTNICHKKNIILEPSGRNTAPCILLSLAHIVAQGKSSEEVVSVVPSDHVILNTDAFKKDIENAAKMAAEKNVIVTIGIKPTFPHTGFGYIQKSDESVIDGHMVENFKEKPDLETAKEYVASGNYVWNAGMFVSRIDTFLSEMKTCSPETFKAFDELVSAIKAGKEVDDLYDSIPANSVDYAVMEKSQKIAVLQANFDWNDLGSWDALSEVIKPVENNTIVKCDRHYLENAKGNIIFTPNKFVSLIDVDDLIVVSNDKNVVVTKKSSSQKIKNIVGFLKDNNIEDLL